MINRNKGKRDFKKDFSGNIRNSALILGSVDDLEQWKRYLECFTAFKPNKIHWNSISNIILLLLHHCQCFALPSVYSKKFFLESWNKTFPCHRNLSLLFVRSSTLLHLQHQRLHNWIQEMGPIIHISKNPCNESNLVYFSESIHQSRELKNRTLLGQTPFSTSF